jgi:hypothetical protein
MRFGVNPLAKINDRTIVVSFRGKNNDGDAIKFLERVPRVEFQAIAPIVEFMGKKPIPLEAVADNSIVDRLVREGFIEKLYNKR